MSAIEPYDARIGRLGCACPEDATRALRRQPGQWQLAGGFALVVLAQALTIGVLPLAGAMLTDEPRFATLPLAVFLLGAACASVPATFLLDAFGRRAGFALGASLGVAGGLIAAYAITVRAFPVLLVGCAWLGAAQGFAMFYRHAAAFGAGAGSRSSVVARLLGAGALAGLVGPLGAWAAEALFVPYTFVGTLLLAAIAQLGALTFAVLLPEARFSHADDTVQAMSAAVPAPALPWRELTVPTLLAGAVWMAMTSTMASAPLALAGCGIALPVISGFVAWHVVAMYAPALVCGALASRLGTQWLAALGLALALSAAIATRLAPDAASIGVAFLIVGAGWSLATLGATLRLHERGTPSRGQLAVHDVSLLIAALIGAML